MTTIAEPQTSLLDARPSHCPECDYALDGLSDVGKCPECGKEYDASCLILRGYQTGRDASYATGTRQRMWWSLVGWTFILLMQAAQLAPMTGRRRVGDWALILFVFAMMLSTMVRLMARRASLDGPPMQLWLCADGYWLRDRTRKLPSGATRRVNTVGGWIFTVVICAYTVYLEPVLALAIICVAVIPIALLWRFARADPVPTTTRVIGGTDAVTLNSWEPTTKARVERTKPGQYRITVIPDNGPFWKLDLRRPQDFLTELSDADAAMLRARLTQWINASGSAPKPVTAAIV